MSNINKMEVHGNKYDVGITDEELSLESKNPVRNATVTEALSGIQNGIEGIPAEIQGIQEKIGQIDTDFLRKYEGRFSLRGTGWVRLATIDSFSQCLFQVSRQWNNGDPESFSCFIDLRNYGSTTKDYSINFKSMGWSGGRNLIKKIRVVVSGDSPKVYHFDLYYDYTLRNSITARFSNMLRSDGITPKVLWYTTPGFDKEFLPEISEDETAYEYIIETDTKKQGILATYSTYAEKDGIGNNIHDTYVTRTEFDTLKAMVSSMKTNG